MIEGLLGLWNGNLRREEMKTQRKVGNSLSKAHSAPFIPMKFFSTSTKKKRE
jgi:hypothetical protein